MNQETKRMKDQMIDLENLNKELHFYIKSNDHHNAEQVKNQISEIEKLIINPKNMEKEPFFDAELLFKIALFASLATLFYLITRL